MEKSLYDESSLLFVRPSFLRGIARIVAPHGKLVSFNYSPSDMVADTRGLRSDWRAVGRDMVSAVRGYGTAI